MKHRASKRPFVVVSEDEARGSGLSPAGAGPAARRARRAASAAVGEASLGEVGDDDAGDADPSAGLDEDESDDDGAFEMRPTTVGPDADATRDSSSDDERDSEREQTGARRAPRGGARGVSRFIPAIADLVCKNPGEAEDADADADSEELNREATRLAFSGSGAKRGAADAAVGAVGAGDPKRARTAAVRDRCPVCDKLFKGPQGVPGHYKKHINDGKTREEKEAGRAAWEEHKAYMAAKKTPKPRAAHRGRPATARQLPPEAEASDGGAEDADVPEDPGLVLEPSARACTVCAQRCRTRRELIDHMLEPHGVEAREREEVDGPMGDLAGMQPFAGEEQHDIAPYALPGYDAHALGTPTRERRSGHDGTRGDATGPDARLADVEVVREMMIRQQTTDRQLDELKAENRAMRSMLDELRRHIALSADQTQIKRVANGDQDLGYAPITVFGRSVYLTGVVGATCGHDVALQTGEALNRLKQILNKAGTDLAHVLRVTVYVSDIRFVEKMNFAWDKFFDVHQVERHLRPTRVTQAACLKFPEIHVEMHAEAVIPAPPLQEGVAGLLPGPAGATPA